MNKKMIIAGLAILFIFSTEIFAQAVGASSNLTVAGLLFEPDPQDPTVADCWGYTDPQGREYGLIGVRRGTEIVDVTDVNNPFEVTFIPGATSLWHDVKVYQNYAYTASDVEGAIQGIQVIDLSVLPSQPQVIRSIMSNGIGRIHNLGISQDRPLMFAVNEATGGGVFILDLTDPANPTYITRIAVGTHDVYSKGDLLFLSTGGTNRVRVYNIANPAQPQQIANFQAPGMGYSHNNWPTKNGDYLITTEEVAGNTMKMWDISNLNSPQIVDEWVANNSYIAHQVMVHQDLAFVAHYGMGLRIVDVTDPTNMTEIAWHRPEAITSTQNRGFDGTWGLYVFPSGKAIHSHNPGSGMYVVQLNQQLIDMAGLPGPTSFIDDRRQADRLKILNANQAFVRFNLEETGHFLFQMFNTAGRQVKSIKSHGTSGLTTLSIDDSGLANGHYVLKLSQGSASSAARISIEK